MVEKECVVKRVDSAGRVTLPKPLRMKYNMEEGTEVEMLTMRRQGLTYLCMVSKEMFDAKVEEIGLEAVLTYDGGGMIRGV